ncbi:MAG TPA: hypothetical protein VN719_05910, partial [Gemmatimonadales bacterium]|nr:hypothetical protein [Gemmatimonadales bacterium]
LRGLGRYLGKQIRESEAELQGFKPDTPPAKVIPALLDHWRARNRLSRYRMHSKSAWFTLSLVLLYIAVVALLVAAGIRSNVLG